MLRPQDVQPTSPLTGREVQVLQLITSYQPRSIMMFVSSKPLRMGSPVISTSRLLRRRVLVGQEGIWVDRGPARYLVLHRRGQGRRSPNDDH